MTTVQIVGIAVSVGIVVALVIALVVTRGRDERGAGAGPGSAPSFLDSAPRDTLAKLGSAERRMEDVTLDPGVVRAREHEGAGLEWPDESDTLGGSPYDLLEEDGAAHPGEPAEPPATDASAAPATDAAATAPDADRASAAGRRVVPLSDIIVTTSDKTVDLGDPEVRRMLTELVSLEIDQATELRAQGQTVDAVLHLSEAEKISRALGMDDAARHVRQMLEDVQGG